jgi:hypothetical protein
MYNFKNIYINDKINFSKTPFFLEIFKKIR